MLPAIDLLFSGAPEVGRTDALVVTRRRHIEVERYGVGVDAATTLRSWSMAKSMLHATVGMLVADGELTLDAPAPVAAWAGRDDPRRAITLRHLLTMRSGLAWIEEPIDGRLPDVVTMLYGNDRRPVPDTAAFAADRPLAHEPGSVTHYSSGTSAIVSGIVRDVVGPGEPYRQWLRERLFDPVGMTSATPRFDAAGTWMASSFCFCTARDFARFGQLYLDGGVTSNGMRILDAAWTDTAAIETGREPDGMVHTMHWWRFGENAWGAFYASGYEGQYIVVVPELDLVVVRLGQTPTEQRAHVRDALTELIASFES